MAKIKEDYKEKLKEALNSDNTDYEVVRWIEQNFPELKESEDEKVRKSIIKALRSHSNSVNSLSSDGFKMEDVIAWLERQGEQKPVEWNEEDIMRIDNLIAIIENRGYPDYVEYLEKLKYRVQWKPSDEQIMYIGEAIDLAERSERFSVAGALKDLRKQLKKLREE